jgi:hypothetical protein
VLTNQTSPVASADVLCYVETSLEEADFASPMDPQELFYGSYLQVQTDEQQVTVQECNIAGVEIDAPKNLHNVYMGENISSMRQLMRRRAFYRSMAGPSGATTNILVWAPLISRKPMFTGYDSNNTTTLAVSTLAAPATIGFNFVNELVSNMFAPCFVGERGSYNYDFNLVSSKDTGFDSMTCSRSYTTMTTLNENTNYSTTSTGNSQKQNAVLKGMTIVGKPGSGLTNQKTQSGLSVQAPFYSRYRFTNTNPSVRRNGNSVDDSDTDTLQLTIASPAVTTVGTAGINLSNTYLEVYCGIGTDYQLLTFVNVPSTWYYTSRPESS